jgi:hypothetical protein
VPEEVKRSLTVGSQAPATDGVAEEEEVSDNYETVNEPLQVRIRSSPRERIEEGSRDCDNEVAPGVCYTTSSEARSEECA